MTPTLVAVLAGQQCVGHVLQRGHAFEAFDADDRSIGTYKSRDEAVAAIATGRGAL
jgi:hypothetical protein